MTPPSALPRRFREERRHDRLQRGAAVRAGGLAAFPLLDRERYRPFLLTARTPELVERHDQPPLLTPGRSPRGLTGPRRGAIFPDTPGAARRSRGRPVRALQGPRCPC